MSPLEDPVQLHLPGDHLALGAGTATTKLPWEPWFCVPAAWDGVCLRKKEGKRENKSYNTMQCNTIQYNKLKSNEGPENQG